MAWIPSLHSLDWNRRVEAVPGTTKANAVFTGLVEGVGTVQDLVEQDHGLRICIDAKPLAEGAAIGDSIAINGCCLTVVSQVDSVLAFEAGAETLDRTNLGSLSKTDVVNLERSLRVGDRLGGHFVTGHIDTVARIVERINQGDWSTFWFELAPNWMTQVVSKGSIAVDGISLTVVEVTDCRFSVALIPHTIEVTTFGRRRIHDSVNIETDLLAKYVQRQNQSI